MKAARGLPMGAGAVLIEVNDIASVVALNAALRSAVDTAQAPWNDVQDIVPAARTVLLIAPGCADVAWLTRAAVQVAKTLDEPTGRGAASADEALRTADAAPDRQEAPRTHDDGGSSGHGDVVSIAVTYDGEDLDDIARITGLTHEHIVEAHTGTTWTVAFFGFAPGFAYLAGGDPRLQVPRRDEPRTSVPPGAVGLAGEFSAIYPRSSPGGWQLLGHTDEPMWDVEAKRPSRLQPGDRVRFMVAGDR